MDWGGVSHPAEVENHVFPEHHLKFAEEVGCRLVEKVNPVLTFRK